MKCDNCFFKKEYIGAGPPDDYSMEYCSKGHWEGGPPDDELKEDVWALCIDYRCQDCNGSSAVEIGDGEYSVCPCSA